MSMDQFVYAATNAGVLVLLAMAVQIWFSAGLFILATPLFMSVGVFVSTYLSVELGWNVGVSILASVLLGSMVTLVFVPLIVRLRGIYLAMATIAVSEMARILALNLTSLTGGAGGRIVPRSISLWHVALALGLCSCVGFLLQRSKRGEILALVRHDWRVALLLGYQVRKLQLGMLLVGILISTFAGAIYAHSVGFVSPQEFGLSFAIDAIAISVIGGRFHWFGPILGGIVLVLVPEFLGLSNTLMDFTSGLLLIIVLVLFPLGLSDKIQSWFHTSRVPRPDGKWGHGTESLRDEPATTQLFNARDTSRLVATGGTPDKPLVAVRNVCLSYGGVTAVDDVSFTVESGVVLGIIGPNGAGKTSLINVCCGLIRASSGAVHVGEIGVSNLMAANRVGIARTFQHVQLVNALSLYSNIRLGIGTRKQSRAVTANLVSEISELVGLNAELYLRPPEVSLGKRRLTELARALASRPTVLFLDEPTTGCDIESIDLMSVAIRKYANSGGTVIVISHDVAFVTRVAEQVLLLSNGKRVKVMSSSSVVSDEDVHLTYLGGEPVASIE